MNNVFGQVQVKTYSLQSRPEYTAVQGGQRKAGDLNLKQTFN